MPTLDVISVNIWSILISLCNLLILFFIIKKFLYKPVRKMLAARQAAVDKVYSEADEALRSAEQDRLTYSQKLEHADSECDALLKSAKENADRRGSEIISDAQSQAAGIMRRANAEIELEKQKAADGMRRRIADISVDVAEKLLARSVDGSEHRRLIDSAIDEIGNEDVNNQ